jgi:hypothetical protein
MHYPGIILKKEEKKVGREVKDNMINPPLAFLKGKELYTKRLKQEGTCPGQQRSAAWYLQLACHLALKPFNCLNR